MARAGSRAGDVGKILWRIRWPGADPGTCPAGTGLGGHGAGATRDAITSGEVQHRVPERRHAGVRLPGLSSPEGGVVEVAGQALPAPVALRSGDRGAAGQDPHSDRPVTNRAASSRRGGRPQPRPAGMGRILPSREGNSGRKFNAVDGYVHERLAIFASRKHGRRGRNWTTRYTGRWLERLGVYRLTGNVHWATAHANR